ncbi:MAG: peroxiredoxin [Patescibacteria group bacterium]|jgi:alkyl hydroperoxide reductase subunit AhpC
MLKLNQPAPDFKGTASQKGQFKTVSLADYKGKWLVFFFYPRDFTFVCPTELKAFAGMEPEFSKANAQILAASTDSEWSHQAWFERDLPQVQYPVLADVTHQISKAYEVLNENDGSAERGLFIIDPDQNIRYQLVSDGSVGRSASETLRVLQALQTGALCPADWKVGEKTLS